ncbi:hypothetical protein C7B65_22335 [Phormidesmis priestleyi ULC007]|uniref:Uncharacterized protein n=1 Tax=Phormidesmis priestleyi ULC007 TaxID=1920490 RepID=A0A2T1D6X3_9CYAN|nr:hypothetical protein C7B65_22335 [Phormidesmis priestleyi ULC007]
MGMRSLSPAVASAFSPHPLETLLCFLKRGFHIRFIYFESTIYSKSKKDPYPIMLAANIVYALLGLLAIAALNYLQGQELN